MKQLTGDKVPQLIEVVRSLKLRRYVTEVRAAERPAAAVRPAKRHP